MTKYKIKIKWKNGNSQYSIVNMQNVSQDIEQYLVEEVASIKIQHYMEQKMTCYKEDTMQGSLFGDTFNDDGEVSYYHCIYG